MNDKETLEEVAKSHAIYELENNYKPTKESFKLACKRNFIRGAKWQAERMYSEEEVRKMFSKYNEVIAHRDIEEWQPWIDKQFKKEIK